MSLPKSLPSSRIKPASDAPVIRWGILGSGWIAEKFIESVRAHTKQNIVAVGSRDKQRAEQFASRMDLEKAYGNYDELVAASDLDVIYVATPHNLHHEGVTLALNAGKHVLRGKTNCPQPRANARDGGACSAAKAVFRRSIMDVLSSKVRCASAIARS